MIGWLALDGLANVLFDGKSRRARRNAKFDRDIAGQSDLGFQIVFWIMSVILFAFSVFTLITAFPFGLGVSVASIYFLVKAYVSRQASRVNT